MNFSFKCPNCDYLITAQDFQENEKILSHLNEIFNNEKEQYIKKLELQLYQKWDQETKQKINSAVLAKEIEIYTKNQKEVKNLEEIINEQKVKIANFDENVRATIAEKKAFFEKENAKEIKELNNKIIEQKILIETSSKDLQIKILEANKQISDIKDKEIENLKEQINELKINNMQFKVIQNKTKGENFEHDVEAELRKVFEPQDVITKITSQEKKADYLHEVKKDNKIIGKIVYEIKNAEWSNNWEKKLISDMASSKAKYGIIVCTNFNKKFPGIPFKRSDYNQNIYFCDSESFYFIGQILKTLVEFETNLLSSNDNDAYAEQIKRFNNWKLEQLPIISKAIQDSCQRIADAEKSITNKVNDIRIGREKIIKCWIEQIKDFLDKLIW